MVCAQTLISTENESASIKNNRFGVCVCVCVCVRVCVRVCVEKGADVVQSGSVRCPTAQMPKGGLNLTL